MYAIRIIICMLLFPLCAYSQTGTIKGTVYDPVREMGLAAGVYLLSSDSSVVQSTATWVAMDDNGKEDMKAPCWFKIQNIQGGKKYILKVECPKYETEYIDIVADFSNRDKEIDLGEIWMMREAVKLREVAVQGTRLLMVNKGDTTVYNVATLVTSDGDMLSDLIAKLPGAELRDGKIYMNGKYVEKLLIGGKDFFNGDIDLALQQLPAYTVGKIKTYEMQGEASELTGHDMGDKQFVMDVIMKKQYNAKWLAEILLAGGTRKRFNILGRLLYFDDRQAFTVVGETNNLGRSVGDIRSSYIDMNNNPIGDINERSAHVNYRFEPSRDFKVGLNGSVGHKDEKTFQRTSVETYLDQSNNYAWSYNRGRAIETNADLLFNLSYKPMKSLQLNTSYNFIFNRNHVTDFSRSFSTLDNPNGTFSTSSIDSVFIWPSDYDILRNWVQTRQQQEESRRGHNFVHNGTLAAKKAFGKNVLSVDADFNHRNNDFKAYNLFSLDYPISALPDDYRHRFTDSKTKQYTINANTNYTISYERDVRLIGWVRPFLKFKKNYTHSDNPLYRLDWAESEVVSDLELLPTDADVLISTLDPANSAEYHQHINRYETGVDFLNDLRLGEKTWMRLDGKLPFEIWDGNLDYSRFDKLFQANRTDYFVNPELSARLSLTPNDREGNKHTMTLSYNLSNQPIDLQKTLNFTDASNPLVITKGNPDLRNSMTHNIKWGIKFEQRERMKLFQSTLHYAKLQYATCYERIYNTSTGVLVQSPINIDGNWSVNWTNVFLYPLKRNQKLILDGGLTWRYGHSRDLNVMQAGDNQELFPENSVNTSQTDLRLSLTYRPMGKLYLRWQVRPIWNNIRGTRQDFETINSYHINYYFETRVNLPYKINVSSTLNVNSRYGFADKSLCKTYFLWNAKVERAFGKKISLSLEANDLLHQNNGISVAMDAQGRTETFRKQIPPYVLLGFTYRIGK